MLLLPAIIPQLDKVHHCRAEDMLTALPSNFVDLIVTSPPYDNLRTYKGFSWDFEYVAHQSYRVLKLGGVLVWVVGDETVDFSETFTSLRQALYFRDAVGFNALDTMIYLKESYAPAYPSLCRYASQYEFMFVFSKGKPRVFNPIQRAKQFHASGVSTFTNRDGTKTRKWVDRSRETKDASNVWAYSSLQGDKGHPAVFPNDLAQDHILSWSNPGDIVLDYFGGSGTTAKMARINNRRFLTNDISAEYCELMERRLAMPYTPNMFEAA